MSAAKVSSGTILLRLWKLITPPQRLPTMILLGLMLAGSLLEALGIGMVIPVLGLLTQPDLGRRYPQLVPLLEDLGNPSQIKLVVFGMITLVLFYAIKSAFLALLAWRQTRFEFGLQAELSQRLFAGYLRQPYSFHLQRNSAELIRNAIGQVDGISTLVHQALVLLTEIPMLALVTVLLVLVEPQGTITISVSLGILGWIFQRLTRANVLRWGKTRERHEILRIQHLQQGLGAAKDLKLLGRETDFLAQYDAHNAGSAKFGRRQAAVQAMPRLVLEFMAISALAALIVVLVRSGRPMETIVPILGVFGAAAFRLLPSVSRILGSLQHFQYFNAALDSVSTELESLRDLPVQVPGRPFEFRGTLDVQRVSFRYAGAEAPALRDVSLSIQAGTMVGFVGTSGAGKSTLVDILLGLLTPQSGVVRVDGVDIETNLRGWQDQVGYVPQTIYLTDDSLRRNIALGLPDDHIDDAAVRRAVEAAQLGSFVADLPAGLETVVGERGVRLSGGQRQRIGIARALYHDPAVLVLDEATSALDLMTERDVMEGVLALHGAKTILIVAHRRSTVEHCDRLYRLEKGLLVSEEKV